MASPNAGPARGRPTLETVAARAGVSKSLVSLVLRNSPKVSPARREAVMRAVDELGYRPNAAARRLAENRSRTIGVLLNDIRQPYFADLLDGLTPVLHAAGQHILLGDGRVDRMMDETLTWSFLEHGVDGLILAGSVPMSRAIAEVTSKIPASRPAGWTSTCRRSTSSPTTTRPVASWRSGTSSSSGTAGSPTSPGCRGPRACSAGTPT